MSRSFGRDVLIRLGVAIPEESGPPIFYIEMEAAG